MDLLTEVIILLIHLEYLSNLYAEPMKICLNFTKKVMNHDGGRHTLNLVVWCGWYGMIYGNDLRTDQHIPST